MPQQEFYSIYIKLYQLRELLRIDTRQLVATTTADDETEEYITKELLRPIRLDLYITKIIRGSIDRPDTIYIFKTILKEHYNNYNILSSIVEKAIDLSNTQAILERIPKTLVFIDSRRKVAKFIEDIRYQLIKLTKNNIYKKYNWNITYMRYI